MSNSKLVNYKKISPFYSTRNGAKIDRIAIHHMAGNLSVETCGQVFQTRRASATYGVGTDGRVGQYVDEKNAPWTTSNYYQCDKYAVTIEVANSKTGGDWPVSDKALQKTIELCVDICKRNGIKKLNFTGDKRGNLLQHCWFDATACPGPYLKSKFKYIADQVNGALAGGVDPEPTPKEKIDEDGIIGAESTVALQEFLGVDFTPDGVIGGQYKPMKKYFPAIVSCTFEDNGSDTIEFLQRFLKSKGQNPGDIDGRLGPTTNKAWQKYLEAQGFAPGTADGIIGSATALAIQKWLNKNR